MIPLLLAAFIAFIGAAESNFSVTARTEVVAVEPSCSLTLNWNLGKGSITRAEDTKLPGGSKPVKTPPACIGAEKPVQITLRAGSRAVLEQLPGGGWQVNVSRSSAFAGCASDLGGGHPVFEAWVDKQECAAGASGITYVSMPAKRGEDGGAQPQDFAHLLEGRVVLGAPLLEPGGWNLPAGSALREAKISARIRAALTHQSISVLEESVEAGAIIDTSPAPGEPMPTARGFVRPNKDGGLDVLVHVTSRQIGITPHAGERRALSVTRWSQLLASPFLQALLLAFGVVVGLAQAVSTADSLDERRRKHQDEHQSRKGNSQ